MSTRAVLLLSCADQKGLVASVADFVYRHDGNILHADEHMDLEQRVFLQRVEWELLFAHCFERAAPGWEKSK